ncbi:MAG: Smr/MutS family protein [Deltaproteobacteria bacterium]|nr:Smr/MutS family protein [Deltaproteobacteria bacterium]
MSRRKQQGFNSPFAGLKLKVEPPKQPPAPARPPPPSRKKASAANEEARQFLEALDGVTPLTRRKELPPELPRLQAQVVNEEAEAFAQLNDLVSERGDFTLEETASSVEGHAPGVDPRLVRALKRGDHPVTAELDLHGLSRDAARAAVERFLSEARRAGRRCVLLVHGRGLHSEQQLPVLKAQLPGWLQQGRMGRLVLAFCTARSEHGGAGALYVLLRK